MIGVVIGAFLPELQKQRSEREERDKLHRLIEEQRALHARYEREIGWLEHDPEYLGIIARDKLDLMKPGETILRVDAAKPPAPETQRVEPSKPPAKLLN